MVSAGTEIGGYKLKLSLFGDKGMASMYPYIYIDMLVSSDSIYFLQ